MFFLIRNRIHHLSKAVSGMEQSILLKFSSFLLPSIEKILVEEPLVSDAFQHRQESLSDIASEIFDILGSTNRESNRSSPQSKNQVEYAFIDDVGLLDGLGISQGSSSKNESLLVRRNSLFLLNLP